MSTGSSSGEFASASVPSTMMDMNATTRSGSSNSTTPSSTSPVPPSQPSPLTIGKTFIRQFYQVLSGNNSPETISRFYKPSSILSHSLEASTISEAQSLKEMMENNKLLTDVVCFDLKDGAIDAQETVNGGILLVVTGHLTLGSTSGPRQFVHTFVLNNGAPPGRKRQFYVHNDILRLLAGDSIAMDTTNVEPTSPTTATATSPEPTAEEATIATTASAVETAVVELLVEDKETAVVEALVKEEETTAPPSSYAATSLNGLPTSDALLSTKVDDVVVEEQPPSPTAGDVPEPTKDETLPTATTIENSNVVSSASSVASLTEQLPPSTDHVKPYHNNNKSNHKKAANSKTRGGRNNYNNRSSSPSANDKSNNNQKQKVKPKGSWASLVAGGAAPKPHANTNASHLPATMALLDSGAVEESKENLEGMDGIDGPKDNSTTTAPVNSNESPAVIEATKETNTNATTNANTNTSTISKLSHPPPRNSQNNRRSAPSPSSQADNNKQRIPDATLFIKNVPDKTKEPEIRAMFEPFAAQTNCKILGITLVATRGFCFVDFSDKEAVTVIVQEAKKSSPTDKSNATFMIHNRILDVERKVAVESKNNHRNHQSNNNNSQRFRHHRSDSPGNNSGSFNNKSGRRKTSPRRGGAQRGGGNRGSGNSQQHTNSQQNNTQQQQSSGKM